jgi:hypothetical protein
MQSVLDLHAGELTVTQLISANSQSRTAFLAATINMQCVVCGNAELTKQSQLYSVPDSWRAAHFTAGDQLKLLSDMHNAPSDSSCAASTIASGLTVKLYKSCGRAGSTACMLYLTCKHRILAVANADHLQLTKSTQHHEAAPLKC